MSRRRMPPEHLQIGLRRKTWVARGDKDLMQFADLAVPHGIPDSHVPRIEAAHETDLKSAAKYPESFRRSG